MRKHKKLLSAALALMLIVSSVPVFAESSTDFSDVYSGTWYYDSVKWAVNSGIVQGYPDGSFGVGRVCTENEAITMLWRAAGSPDVGMGTNDTEKAMKWLKRQSSINTDFVKGTDPVNRINYVLILYVALGDMADIPADVPFTDLAEPLGEYYSYYEPAVRWALAKGLINGISDTEFCPLWEMTREQVVTMLRRAFENGLTYQVTDSEVPYYVASTVTSFPVTLSFMDSQTDVPFLSVQEMVKLVTNAYKTLGAPFADMSQYALNTDFQGNRVVITRNNGFSMILDFDTDKITFIDYDAFLRFSESGTILDLVQIPERDEQGRPWLFQRQDSSSERYGKAVTFNLAAYGLRMIRQGDNYYIPLQTVSDLLLSTHSMGVLYNGQAVFSVLSGDLEQMYYSAPTGSRSPALALFTYKELCFALDHLYGLKSQHNIESFPEEFEMNGLKVDLLSTDPTVSDQALDKLTAFYFDDMHSGNVNPSFLEGKDITWTHQYGASTMNSAYNQMRMAEARKAAFPDGVPGYQEVGDTAYITFDGYTLSMTDYYSTPPDENTKDTIGLILYAYSQITREGSPVKNVVLDLSLNGGGSVPAAAFNIGAFVGQGSISIRNTLTDALLTQNFKVDLNLDRVFDEKDSLKDYNLYCLVSLSSFSCGNLVPSALKNSNRVTILGKTSGGGSCEVLNMTTADGVRFQMSSPFNFSYLHNGSFYDIDQGVTPDFVINSYDNFYNREALTEYIHNLF